MRGIRFQRDVLEGADGMKKVILFICILSLLPMTACAASERIDEFWASTVMAEKLGTSVEPVGVGYFKKLYADQGNVGYIYVDHIGSATDPATNGYIGELYVTSNTSLHTMDGSTFGFISSETDPVFTASPSFLISLADINDWSDHPAITTGIHGVGAGNVVGTTLVQELDNKTLDSSVGKGTWTASGTWKLPDIYLNGDITTDRWLNQDSNTFLGVDVVGAGNLAHTGGAEGYQNTIIGHYGGYSLATGQFNNIWGAGCLFYLTTGNGNTGFGVLTGNKITTGSYNVMIGYMAGPTSNANYGLYINIGESDTPLISGNFSTDDLHFYATTKLGINDTNYSQFSDDGTLTMAGTARTINSVWVDAGGIKAPGAKPATAIAHGTLETPAWQFGSEEIEGNQETVSFSLRIPERMDRTVAPTLSIAWSSTTTGGNVKWQLEYVWRRADESTTVAAEETLTVTSAVSGTAEGLVLSTFTGINPPGSSDVCCHCRITRLSADAADTANEDIEMHGICFSWTSNKLGGDT